MDKQQRNIYVMLIHQLPTWFIADRLGKSERQIRRHARRLRASRTRRMVQANAILIRSGRESDLWRHYRRLGYSYDRIALIFGRSKQAIQQSLTSQSYGAA